MALPILTRDDFIATLRAGLARGKTRPYTDFSLAPLAAEPAQFALVVGAGFSAGVVPMVHELLTRTIGDYYFPDQDQSSVERPDDVRSSDSAAFWQEFNQAAVRVGEVALPLDRAGHPQSPGEAYQRLFAYRVVSAMFGGPGAPVTRGEHFLRGFLRYLLEPGAQAGHGSTGRSALNDAHLYLAALLEAQQSAHGWPLAPFCRTIFTTNFDTLLPTALQVMQLQARITDRPERGIDAEDLQAPEGPVHLVYTHGSILRYNPASATTELDELAARNVEVLYDYLRARDVLVVGYGGWGDSLMAALSRGGDAGRVVYWCGVRDAPPASASTLAEQRGGGVCYIPLGRAGSDGLMRALYAGLVADEGRVDPAERYRRWQELARR